MKTAVPLITVSSIPESWMKTAVPLITVSSIHESWMKTAVPSITLMLKKIILSKWFSSKDKRAIDYNTFDEIRRKAFLDNNVLLYL
jgi:hypothetical protein